MNFAGFLEISVHTLDSWEGGKRNIPDAKAEWINFKLKDIVPIKAKIVGGELVSGKELDKFIKQREIEETTIPDTEIIPNKNGNEFLDLGGGLKLMKVPLLEINAQAGFADNYQDSEHLANIEDFHSIIVREVHHGKYIAFRVKGDSMDDGTSEAILPNSIVTCRELQRQHWMDKIRFNQFPYWVIATSDSSYPLLKKITDHNVEKGIIKCHSLNNGPEYQDFELHLNNVTALFYVIDVNRTITNKIY